MTDTQMLQVKQMVNPDCGCLEEKFVHPNGAECLIHFEPDGNGELFLDFGEWVDEVLFKNVSTFDELRQRAVNYLDKLPKEE